MDKEQNIIDIFTNKFIGDDGAVIGKMVLSKDMFVENTHFKRGWLSAFEIGQKAMLVNLSDAVAMNAVPCFALLGLGVPSNLKNSYILELCKGIKHTAEKYGVKIIGGDTVKSSEITISLSIISYLQNTKEVSRNGAALGDLVCYTGSLGGSLKGLKTLLNGGHISSKSKFKTPILRDKFMKHSAKFMKCAMDISDGLASDLPKICSKFRVKFYKNISKLQWLSGEEYELLFCISPRNLKRVQNEAKRCRVKLNILGKIIKGKQKTHGKFTHF